MQIDIVCAYIQSKMNFMLIIRIHKCKIGFKKTQRNSREKANKK